MGVEPVPGEPAALATANDRILVLADYHAGVEAALSAEGVEVPSRATERREHVERLLADTEPDHVVVLGDLASAIGTPGRAERDELEAVLEAMTAVCPVTVVKGNHDGDIEDVAAAAEIDVTVTPTDGTRIGPVGFAHGHTWPQPEVLTAETVCTAHEHPMVRLEDEVGGRRIERVWLRGDLNPAPFIAQYDQDLDISGELVVFPAFNAFTGGTWVNAERDFLSPFLPEGLASGEAYLLDGTRLGPYDRI